MDVNSARLIIQDETLTDANIASLLLRAKSKAKNHHFWRDGDNPTEEELEAFYNRYEIEIYELAKSMYDADSRDGLVSYSELGVSRSWGKSGSQTIEDALSLIPPKTYIL